MYIGMYLHRIGMYMGMYVCLYAGLRQPGSVQGNPFHPWSPSNARSAPLTKRLRNTVGIAKTKPDVALPIHGFFTNILGKGSNVYSKDREVSAFALIVLNVLVIIILILMSIMIITAIVILPATTPATSTKKKH